MLLMRVVAQGRASELLDSSTEMLASDRFYRRLNLYERGISESLLKGRCQNVGEGIILIRTGRASRLKIAYCYRLCTKYGIFICFPVRYGHRASYL